MKNLRKLVRDLLGWLSGFVPEQDRSLVAVCLLSLSLLAVTFGLTMTVVVALLLRHLT